MLTNLPAIFFAALLWGGLVCEAASKPKDYENFSLPTAGRSSITGWQARPYTSDRLQFQKSNPRLKEPSVDRREFIFAKESFLAEKRDQAIKLLRQEMDSGYKNNRDNMLLRLGQLYAEKYMELSYLENEAYTQQLSEAEKAKPATPGAKAKTVKMDNSRSQHYLKDALGIFYNLEKEFPRHPKLDEILFFIGFVEMEAGNGAKGSKYLERVINQYPRSRKFAESVVYLGDYYFDHQKFREALAKYRILIRRSESSLYHYAVYKIAWCELNTGEQKRALSDMKGLVKALEGTQDKAKFNLREQALRDLVIFYGETELVEEAIAFFSETQGKAKALENLRLIADILRSKAKDGPAVMAYERLLRENPNSLDAPLIALGIYESLARLGNTAEAVDRLVRSIEMYGPLSDWAKNYPSEKAAELKTMLDNLADQGKRVGFFYHSAAQKSSNKALFQQAQRLYGALLTHFPNHPERKKIAFYRAEILYAQKRWLECANSYMEASKIPPKDKVTDEAVYNALLALDQLTAKIEKIERYSKEELKKVDLTPQPIPEGENRFIEIAEFYLKEYPAGARVVDVRFRIGAIYYRYHHFDQALPLFREIATKHPKHRSAVVAANIVLDIYNMKKDYDNLDAAAVEFAAMPLLGDAAFKAEMAQISGQIGFKKIEKLETQNQWTDAGEAYFKVYKQNPNGALAEKSLYNAYVSFDKGGDVTKAAEVSRLFIAKYPKSEYTQRLTLVQAKLAEKQYDFDQAQRLYYDYYKKFPKDKEARKALYNAAVFAELTEMNAQALTLYEEYLKGATAEERKAIQISEAKIYRKQGNWEKVGLIYRRMARDARSADEKMALLGELARQYERGGRTAEKATVTNELRAMYNAGGKNAKNTGVGVLYAAEAQFRAVAPQREKYDKIELRFPPADLVYLMKRKQKALTKLAESYDAVVEMGVPDWGVAAMFEKADAYSSFVRAYRGVPVPAKYKGAEREEAEKSLKQIDTQVVKPLEDKAQEFFQVCVTKSAEFHVANEYAARCRSRAKKSEGEADPGGLVPMPNYWSTRPLGEGVAKR